MSFLLSFSAVYIKLFALVVLAQAFWAWQLTWGKLAPKKLLLKPHQSIVVKLNNDQEEAWLPPALIISRWLIVFKRPHWFTWPWLIWPGSLTKQEHQQLRCFLRSWY